MDVPVQIWDGALSIVHPSEIICKILYDKFFLHDEVSIILGTWRGVIQSQRRDYDHYGTASNEAVTRHNNNSFLAYSSTNLKPATSLPHIFNLRISGSKDGSHKQAHSQDSIVISSPKGTPTISPLNIDSSSSSSSSSSGSSVVNTPKSHTLLSSASTPAYAGARLSSSPVVHSDFIASKHIPQYKCFIFPYMSSFGIPKNDGRELKR